MGTTKSGRYLNTHGSRTLASDYATVHSDEGTFTHRNKQGEIRLKSGGHGQAGMDLLDKYGIDYNVVKTYENGVRIGNVPRHKNKLKQTGVGQTWFPKSWSAEKIKQAGEFIAKLPSNANAPNGSVVTGTYDGVRIGVIMTDGKIGTIFPTVKQ